MFGMTMAFAAAGIGQVYLERILGFGYLETQAKIQVHFLMLVATGILFTAGVGCSCGTSSSWRRGSALVPRPMPRRTDASMSGNGRGVRLPAHAERQRVSA